MEVFDAPTHYYPSDAMSLDELSYWITFVGVSGIGPVTLLCLQRGAASRSTRTTRVCGRNLIPVGGAITPTTGPEPRYFRQMLTAPTPSRCQTNRQRGFVQRKMRPRTLLRTCPHLGQVRLVYDSSWSTTSMPSRSAL